MINLLPFTQKKHLARQYKMRLGSLFLLLLVLLGLAGIALLVPSYLLMQNKVAAAKERATLLMKNLQESSQANETNVISETKEKLAAIERESLAQKPFVLFESVTNNRSRGIRLTRFFFSAEGEDGGRVTFTGAALTRDDLISFVRELEANESFASVEFPVSNLAKSTDIDFSVVATLAPQSP